MGGDIWRIINHRADILLFKKEKIFYTIELIEDSRGLCVPYTLKS
jgi:hypothetical protein